MTENTADSVPSGLNGNRAGLSLVWHIALFLLVLLLIFSRRPADLFHAQFYAEDGKRWFAQAYNLHWMRSLLVPEALYLQTLPRLGAGLALLTPFRMAPLVMNLFGAVVQALPVTALLSRRCASFGSLPVRLALAAIYIANPNAPEVHVNLTNAQWHLALLQFLLAFSFAPTTWVGRATDIFTFLIGAISGPFSIAMLPILLLFWWNRRERWTLVLIACLAIGAAVQVRTIVSGVTYVDPNDIPIPGRIEADRIPLGVTPQMFVRIFGGDIIFDSAAGISQIPKFPIIVPAAALAFGIFVIAWALRYGPRPWRYFTAFTVLLLVLSLRSPYIVGSATRWAGLMADTGMRYYFFPTLLFLWSAVYCAALAPRLVIRAAGYGTLLALVLGSARKWEYPRWEDYHFNTYADRLEAAIPGEIIRIPIYPDPWTMTLIKRQPSK